LKVSQRQAGVIVLAVGLLLVFYLPRQALAATSGNPLSLDASTSTNCNACTRQSMDLQVTQGDVVVVQVALSAESVLSRGGGYSVLTSLTSAWPGMPFVQRYAYTTNPGSGDGSLVWEDYAIAPLSGTITITGTVNNSESAWDMIGYSVTGANTTAPFDPNPSIPHYDFNDCEMTDGCSVTYSTTSADTLVIAGIGSEGCPKVTAPGGFTLIQSACTSFGITDAVAYHLFSSPQTNVATGNWVLTPGESALWFVDAIQACVGSCPAPNTAVLQPISIDMSNSAPSANVTVNGCDASPSTFPADGKPQSIVVLPSCAFTLSFSNAGNVRNGFPVSGSFNATSPPQSSCGAGNCPVIPLTAYQQLQNTYRANPATPGTWDAGLTIPVSGTQLGVTGQTGCSISTVSKGGFASCMAWFDYHTQVNVASPVAVSETEQWSQSGGANFTQRTGGNRDTASFIDQFQISFAPSPSGTGSTNPSGSNVWESYGSLPIAATPIAGYLFNTWSANVGVITFTSPDKASTTATILGSGDITAIFSIPVTQPITLALVNPQGVPSNFTLSGCSISPTSLSGDGNLQPFTSLPSCQLTITVASDSPNVRYAFNSGGTLSNTASVLTCSVQTCSEYSTTYYEQVNQQFAYTVVGGAGPYVQAPVLSFIALGTPTTYTVTGNPTTQWLDFGSSWSLVNPLSGSTGAERWFAPSGALGTATAAGEQTTAYQHQYSVLIASSPAECGSTAPSGVNWENASDNFQVMSSAASGCTFSAWEVTGLVTVPQPGQLSTAAFADSNGTLTASFSRNPLPTLPTSTLILITGVGVIAATSIGLLIRSRVSRSRIPPE
jgi:hypothetical protein